MVRHNLRTKINAYMGLFFAALFILVENCKQLQAPRWELSAYSDSESSVRTYSMMLQQGKSVNTNLGDGQGIFVRTVCSVPARRGFGHTWWELMRKPFPNGKLFLLTFSSDPVLPFLPFFTYEKTESLREEGLAWKWTWSFIGLPHPCQLLGEIWGVVRQGKERRACIRAQAYPGSSQGAILGRVPGTQSPSGQKTDWMSCTSSSCLYTGEPKLEASDGEAPCWSCLFLVNLVIT